VSANVYQLIAAVSAAIAHDGISKSRKNAQQGYNFRGIDDVYNALAPVLAKHGLVILPRILTRQCVERTSKSGSAQFFVTVEAEFDFVSSHDSSRHVVRTFGEAQDSADKATNKAMSAAYKYAAFQTFCIPTEGDNDADASTPEPSAPTAPEGYADNLTTLDTLSIPEARAAFKDWPKAHRDYFTTVDKARYDAFKKKGAEFDRLKTQQKPEAA
jgi:hypothetical protein